MSLTARILILSPSALPEITGNALTAERWRRGLTERGFEVEVLATRGLDALSLAESLRARPPQLIHAHHALHSGALLLTPPVEVFGAKIPLVVSPGGTDVNVDWKDAEKRKIMARICRRARFIIVQSGEALGRLRELFPETGDRLLLIPKSILFPGKEKFDLREAAGCGPKNLLFFFPAGIRPVKGNLECLRRLKAVCRKRRRIRVLFAGPALDSAYAEKFAAEMAASRAFARWVPPIPPPAMLSAYGSADVVLNGSFSEGLSNALLEATAAGRPVLASKIPGNRLAVLGKDGDLPMGLLYDPEDPEDFVRKALILIDDDELRRKFGEAGLRRAATLPTLAEEAGLLTRVYEQAIDRKEGQARLPLG